MLEGIGFVGVGCSRIGFWVGCFILYYFCVGGVVGLDCLEWMFFSRGGFV